ncbi:MAG: filamentous hemagglutinin N-terminal domain-containing protein [Methylophilaceae bacterium]
MNHCYRLVWSQVHSAWVAVTETARSHGKTKSSKQATSPSRRRGALAPMLSIAPRAALLLALSPAALAATVTAPATNALPTGGVVAAGSATISSAGSVMNINQATQRAIINWSGGFDVGSNATVNITQINNQAVLLNRVLSNSPSRIFGQINANGHVFLLNQHGTYFAPGSQINVGGLLASTMDVADNDFMNNSSNSLSNAGGGLIEALGNINAGSVALVGNNISNSGNIIATTVSLVSGDTVAVDLTGNNLIRARIVDPALSASIANSGTITAAMVTMSAGQAQNALSSIVNNTGTIRAVGLSNEGGVISLVADVAILTGGLNASGTTGGNISINADHLLQAAAVSADGTSGAGGNIAITANNIIQTSSTNLSANSVSGTGGNITVAAGQAAGGRLFSSATMSSNGDTGGNITVTGNEIVLRDAHLDASGKHGGGNILVGGDLHGANAAIANAQNVAINFSSTFKANANNSGNGGKVVVWSDNTTKFFGDISARGGAISGDGGQIEVSGKQSVSFGGFANAGAPHGTNGTFLLDPKNIIIAASGGGASVIDLVDPLIGANNLFGQNATVLSNGNIVVLNPLDDFVSANADSGAVHLFNGTTGALISSIVGSTTNDQVGSNGITVLSNGNFVVRSSGWDNSVGAISQAGAVTWGNASTGFLGGGGAVNSANSLIGVTAGDSIGSSGVTALSNGNYVVGSGSWDNGGVVDAGAATWGNGTSGTVGTVSAANSLVGATLNDKVGFFGIKALNNGNYVVSNYQWNNGGIVDAGAVTWVDGSTGFTSNSSNTISSANSLVGSATNDRVGINTIVEITDGAFDNYLVSSAFWNDGGVVDAGAVTWVNGSTGLTSNGINTISAANSLVGASANDLVGIANILTLTNGNYVVSSYNWDNGATVNAGAVTWGNGSTGIAGTVSTINSLYGTTANDQVGGQGNPLALSNGNYVIVSGYWGDGVNTNVGAVTWGNGTTGTTGAVSSSNSLIGSTTNDQIGTGGIVELTGNGNYLVKSYGWDNGAATEAGAVTWGSGTSGVYGVLNSGNSLVGSTANDFSFTDVTTLSNGNYVVRSATWDNGGIVDAGAATWGNGATGISGVVSAANSLVGTMTNDEVSNGGVTALSNGNYVVSSYNWDNGATNDAGAATWGNGTTGITGAVSAVNSLVGSTVQDYVGGSGITALSNGNYVVGSSEWDNGATINAGAATWANGTSGITGAINGGNSLVGTTGFDGISSNGIAALTGNGNYVVLSNNWNDGVATSVGAVTWGNGSTGITGAVSSANSLVGSATSDHVGSNFVETLSNGNYVVKSYAWNNGAIVDAGAVTWGNGAGGTVGAVSSANSLVGGTTDDLQSSSITQLSGNNVLVKSQDYDNGAVNSGRVQIYDGSAGGGSDPATGQTYAFNPGTDATITAASITAITNTGTAVTLQANNDITVNTAIISNNGGGNGGDLTLAAGRSILLNANITTDNGALTLVGNNIAGNGVVDAYRAPGTAVITMAAGTTINAGTGYVTVYLADGAGNTNTTGGDITLENITAGTLLVNNSGSDGDIIANGAINVTNFDLDNGKWRQVIASLPTFNASNFTITAGTFTRAKGGDGLSAATAYQIADVYGLQGLGSTGMLSKYSKLVNNINASGTSGWNGGLGFDPIGNNGGGNEFYGGFDGQNFTISNLTINRPASYVGLFGSAAGGSSISNLVLSGGSVTGNHNTGALAGEQYGTVTNVTSSVTVNGHGNSVGGLVGLNGGTINNSIVSGDVTGTGSFTGGLIGWQISGSVNNSHATGDTVQGNSYTGGLVGKNAGVITNSSADNDVTGLQYLGGLVGVNNGSIVDAYATGDVSGVDDIGGLVGWNTGIINIAYATGDVSGHNDTGGLVGWNDSGTIDVAFATGDASGNDWVGGLVGYNGGSVSDAFAAGDVDGNDFVGGLAGSNALSINNTYSIGTVSGNAVNHGGLVGENVGSVTNSFWDMDSSGLTTSFGGTGLTSAEMRTASTFTSAGWDGATIWTLADGAYPVLQGLPDPYTPAVNIPPPDDIETINNITNGILSGLEEDLNGDDNNDIFGNEDDLFKPLQLALVSEDGVESILELEVPKGKVLTCQ